MITIEPPQRNTQPLSDPEDSQAGTSPPPQEPHHAFTLHLPGQEAKSAASDATPVPDAAANRATAAEIIRGKIQRLYEQEPPARQEISVVEQSASGHSKHQEFVLRLVQTGRPLAEIQSAWHQYYAQLPDNEKHEVWQEFYANYERASKFAQTLMGRGDADHKPTDTTPRKTYAAPHTTPPEPIRTDRLPAEQKIQRKSNELQTIASIKSQLLAKISARTTPRSRAHIKSLAFGLSMGGIFLVIFLFSFFNERFITPFIMPGKATASTKLIMDPNQNSDVGPENKIIIPKLNVEVPVVYDAASIEEKAIQHALEGGVVHYPITEKPGELGNGVIVGHSSNNILNKGKYKFAFLMLKKLEAGDTFYVHYNSTRYIYRVYESKIVEPTDVSVLEDTDRPATMTLITCDPPGTSIKRLIIRGEQISPEPAANVASSAVSLPEAPVLVPGNAPTLFQRLTDWLF